MFVGSAARLGSWFGEPLRTGGAPIDKLLTELSEKAQPNAATD